MCWEAAADDWIALARDGDAAFAWNAEAFLRLVPPPGGLTVEVGCGEGRFTRLLRRDGHRVVAVDTAPTLVRAAQEADPAGDYRVADAAGLPVEDGAAGVVVAFMCLQDIADAAGAVREAARVLVPGGRLCAALLHPAWTAGELDGGPEDAELVIRGSYLAPHVGQGTVAARRVPQFHRPLEWYSRALEDAGLLLEALREQPTRRRAPGRIPLFLHLRALKP